MATVKQYWPKAGRPVTLFTGRWADLSLEEVAEMAKGFGYDNLELVCWGNHFDVAGSNEAERKGAG